jgi:hypothetical protein
MGASQDHQLDLTTLGDSAPATPHVQQEGLLHPMCSRRACYTPCAAGGPATPHVQQEGLLHPMGSRRACYTPWAAGGPAAGHGLLAMSSGV